MKTSTKGSFFVHLHGQAVHKTACLIRRRSVGKKKRGVPQRRFEWRKEFLHPWKLRWNPKMEVWKITFLFKQVILRFHVNLQGCINILLLFMSGGFNYFLLSPLPGEMIPIWRAYFSNGLVQPPTRCCFQGPFFEHFHIRIRFGDEGKLGILIGEGNQ